MKVTKQMEAYAKQQMIQLLENISRQPIQCYSEKARGEDVKYYLGRTFIENLIKQVKNN